MSKTKQGLVNWCESKVGTPYVYGAKGGILTQAQINNWASLYPSVYTSPYITKAQRFIGQACIDCSGLISWYTGIVRGSTQYKDTATQTVSIGSLNESMVGWALWKQGHIGVYIGNGYCIEARGIDSGTIKTTVSSNTWTHIIKLCDIDYSDVEPVKNGWILEGKWHYYENGIKKTGWLLYNNNWYFLNPGTGDRVENDWTYYNEKWYYLGAQGVMQTGWLVYKEHWYYLTPGTGAMYEGFLELDGNKYYLKPVTGTMIAGWFQVNGYTYCSESSGRIRKEPFMIYPTADGILY